MDRDQAQKAFQPLDDLFDQHLAAGLHPAASLTVYYEGRPVIRRVGGLQNPSDARPATTHTLFVGFSLGKPLAAACLWVLRDAGELAWDDPVAKFWPEFARHGKDRVLVKHVLTHQAGLPTTPAVDHPARYGDWHYMTDRIAEAHLEFEPGAAIAYHEMTFGWLAGELVRRVSGQPFPRFFARAVKEPLGLADTYFGLPSTEEPRVARLAALPGVERPEYATLMNLPEAHSAVMPAFNVITTAADVARFYDALLAPKYGTVRAWLSEGTLREVTRVQAEGVDVHSGRFARYGLGVARYAGSESKFGPNRDAGVFGHNGLDTGTSWADPRLGLCLAYITSGMQPPETNHLRLATMSQEAANIAEQIRLESPGVS